MAELPKDESLGSAFLFIETMNKDVRWLGLNSPRLRMGEKAMGKTTNVEKVETESKDWFSK